MTTKEEIRRQMKWKQKQISSYTREKEEEQILKHTLQFIEEHKPANVGIYISKENEITSEPILDWLLEHNIRVYAPRLVDESRMDFIPITDKAQLVPGKFGLLEPTGHTVANHLDMLIMPCIAIDLQGNRLGYGSGYYDQYLAHHDVPRVVLAHNYQVLREIPFEEHDQRVHGAITPNGVHLF